MMRETWNFTGSIVSDDGAIAHIGNVSGPGTIHGQGYANSTAAAAADALIAGTDVDYGGAYSGAAQAAVTSGLTTEAVLAAAVRRSLSTRMRMGQFDELNVGRGDLLSAASVVEALDAGSIREAVLDVFEAEPLEETSPLWAHRGVRVTPHVAALSLPGDVARAFAENLGRFREGQPLAHAVDWAKGY